MVIDEKYISSLDYSDISRALSRDFLRIFCVNTDTHVFVEFIPHEHDKALDVSTAGEDFQAVIDDIIEHTFYQDQDMVRTAINKENILHVLENDSSFVLDFRVVQGKRPVYEKIKISRIRQDDPSHILVGIKNTDAHMQRLAKYEQDARQNLSFSAISEALTSDYVCIFYVDARTGEFTEYSSSARYKSLDFSTDGKDFFEMIRNDFSRVVFAEDRELFLQALNKEELMKSLSLDRVFLLTFRVVLEGEPVYVRVKITKMDQLGDQHLVFGLTNIDANEQRLQKYEQMRLIANQDSLTGVKSKHAYSEAEAKLNDEIGNGTADPFAVVVCDVNGLKKINDTLGHQAGDDYLRRSCKMICVVFSHSPVYRIGGDEFVTVLKGNDYDIREELMQALHNLSAAHIGSMESIVSGGMSEYIPGQDHCVSDIFERADALMYKEKMLLKSMGAVTREDESEPSVPDSEALPFFTIRKHILIADDQDTNRVILGSLLETDYDIMYASDGVETLEILRKHSDEIALLLLDLYMPEKNGRDVLREMQIDETLMSIPVIMLTVDKDAELDSLKLGAADFISKPYPDINIVKARIAKCIELSENRDLIRRTQRDKLTGLLHYDYFIQYLDRFEQQHTENVFDAFVCDIKDFHAVNARYGRQFGDLVLRRIGSNFRKLARKTGGFACRQGGDTFLLYCPHQDNYDQLIRNFQEHLFVEKDTADKVKLKYGVYEHADQEHDLENRFACARIAAESTVSESGSLCGHYNKYSDA